MGGSESRISPPPGDPSDVSSSNPAADDELAEGASLDEILSHAAHELRQPATVIYGLASTLAAPFAYAQYGKDGAFWCLYVGAWSFSLANGTCEAVINPLCCSIFREEKTKAMNILHAAWPGGLMLGGAAFLTMYNEAQTWGSAKSAWVIMALPVLAYGVMFLICKKFPVDERVEAKVPMSEMLREFGGLGAFLAATFAANLHGGRILPGG